MLKPLNIIVFDSQDIYKLLIATLNKEHGNKIWNAFIESIFEENDNIISFYLPNKEEQLSTSNYTNELANFIVANSELNYGDIAYIMF